VISRSVEDEGPSFAPAQLSRVYEPFFTKQRGGTGLALSIVHRIMEQHGGQVSAVNRPNGGAILSLRVKADAHGG
jgi:two-component system sensor histidine kinase HydH